jgi:capping protein alpha
MLPPSVAAAAFGTPTGVKCVVSAEKLSLRNFWSGSWRSEFSCAINGSSAVVTGRIRLRIHYFEDGNVQMFTDKPSTDNISFTV